MPIVIDGLLEFDPENENPSTKIEPFIGDIFQCILGRIFVIHFTNGSSEIAQGDLLTGVTSNATARVMRVRVTSGAWALGNAAGTIKIRDMRGDLQTGENLTVLGVYKAKCSVGPQIQTRYKDLVNDVEYASGGVEGYPVAGETIIGCKMVFNFSYPILTDNPYLNA